MVTSPTRSMKMVDHIPANPMASTLLVRTSVRTRVSIQPNRTRIDLVGQPGNGIGIKKGIRVWP